MAMVCPECGKLNRTPVHCPSPTPTDISQAINVASFLATDDGRTLRITSWSPRVAIGEDVTVTIEATILRDAEAEDDQ